MMEKPKCLICDTEKDIKQVNLSENVIVYSCPECYPKIKKWVRQCGEVMNDDCSRQEDSGSARW